MLGINNITLTKRYTSPWGMFVSISIIDTERKNNAIREKSSIAAIPKTFLSHFYQIPLNFNLHTIANTPVVLHSPKESSSFKSKIILRSNLKRYHTSIV